MTKSFYSNGKLLLTGEYAVLDGALSLAVPTKLGQSLSVKEVDLQELLWKSWDNVGSVWFEGRFELLRPGPAKDEQSPPSPNGNIISPRSDRIVAIINDSIPNKSLKTSKIRETLLRILREAQKLNPEFLKHPKGYAIETKLSFPRDWGLGSSSTLINNIAQWAEVDAFELLWNAFPGSGYDIACAQNNHPILYRLKNGKPETSEVNFNPPFQDKLYFIHLNKKQNSREGIAAYRKKNFDNKKLVLQVSKITRKTVSCKILSEFESLMMEHEKLLSQILQMPTVKESLFPDFKGAIKSLGAWGGDFVLATGGKETTSYFERLGYDTVLPYGQMVL